MAKKKASKRHAARTRTRAKAGKSEKKFMVKKPKKQPNGEVKIAKIHWSDEHITKIAGLTASIDRMEGERDSHRAAAAALTKDINAAREKRDAMTRPTLPIDDKGQHNFLADAEVTPAEEKDAGKKSAKGSAKDETQAKEGLRTDPRTTPIAQLSISRPPIDALYDAGIKTVMDLFRHHVEEDKAGRAWFENISDFTLEHAKEVAEAIEKIAILPYNFTPWRANVPKKELKLAGGVEA